MLFLVINLDRHNDRLEHMHGQFSRFGHEFTRIAAIDAQELSREQISAGQAFTGEHYTLGHGEIACFLSHRTAWQHFLDASSEEYCCVFEDDIHLSADARPFLEGDSWFPGDADIVKLETVRRPIRIDKMAATELAERRICRLYTVHPGSGAYVMTRDTAKLLLGNTERFADAVDQVMFNPSLREKAPGGHYAVLAGLRIFQVDEAIAIQDSVLAKSAAPTSNLGSVLRRERRKHASWKTKLPAELSRPFRFVFTFSARKLSEATSGKSWKRITFR